MKKSLFHSAMKLSAALAAFCGASAALPALAQNLPQAFGVAGPTAPAEPKAAVIPLSQSMGIALDQAIQVTSLGPPVVTNAQFVAQDRAAAGLEKPMRYGVGRDVPAQLVRWTAFAVPGQGTLFVTDIDAPTANGLRLHLANMDLPKGAQLMVYKVGDAFIGGPYSGRGLHDSGEMWTATIFDEMVRVECFIPNSGDGVPAAPQVSIDNVQHIYRDLNQLNEIMSPQEGNCYNDVTCFPAYNNLRAASAGIGFIQNNVSLYCSGTMLNTQTSDLTPLWLTANHCLSSESSAQSSEIFWFYHTAACNGAPPALSSVPRSAVCTLLSTGSSSDFTLLQILGALPGGNFWAGWNPNTAGDGTQVACIHHPDGAYKRISFGTKSAATTCGSNHITANWTGLSFTEPGSSGSGLFRVDNQQLIGQLHCGPSACGTGPANRYDGYGSFVNTFNSISGFLANGTDDGFEPNDACAAARSLGGIASNNFSGLIVKSTSPDWYAFNLPANGTVTVTLNFTNAYGDVDMRLFNACGGSILAGSTSTGNSETFTYTNTGGNTTVYLNVYLFSSTRNTYRMDTTVTGVAPGNDNCASAFLVGPGTYSGTTVAATNDGASNCGSSTTSPDVWYRYIAPGTGTITVDTCGSNYDTVIAVHSGCPGALANTLACNDDSAICGGNPPRQSSLTTNVTQGTTYLIRVCGFNNVTGTYIMHLTQNVVTIAPGNNACASAASISVGATPFNTFGATTDGPAETVCTAFGNNQVGQDIWYTYTAACSGNTNVSLCGSSFDTKVAVYDGGCPAGIDTAIACNDDSCGLQSNLTFTSVRNRTYLIRVGGFAGSQGAGTITIGCTPVIPSNNDCANAIGIGNGVSTFDNTNATTDGPSEAACNFFGTTQVGQDLWYRYNAACDGTATASLCGSSFDTKLAAYPSGACPGGPDTAFACSDDSCGLQSNITFPVVTGGTYLIRVGGFLTSVGAGELTLSCVNDSTCAPDFNNDGTLNPDDLADYIGSYFSVPPGLGSDFNNDGTTDPDDLADYIGAYFAGC